MDRFRGKMAEYWDRFWLKAKRSEIGSSVASLFSGNDTPVELFTQALKSRVTMSGTSGDITVKKIADYFRKREEPRCLIDFMNKEEITRVLKTHYPELAGNIISEADRICDGIFSIMGSGDKRLERIDWHLDFKSGYRWNPKKYYKDIEIPYGKADIKVPKELSRFQHLSILGEAYCLTNDEKYAKEFVNQVSNWINNNQPKFGVNWQCTMDVAIRACNWILGYYYFKGSSEITNKFVLKLLKSLYHHGRHIMKNLEYGEITSNHYISDIVGLVYLGMMFPEFKGAKGWRNFGIKELINEMKKQVYPDGCDFEASTCYHRLVLELFFFSTLLVVINDSGFTGENLKEITEKIFGKKYTEKLYKMFEAVLYLLKPNGKMTQIGDNDSGQLFKLHPREVLDMRYLLVLGAIFFKEPKFKIKEFGFCEDALWIFGEGGYRVWQDLEENSVANIGSKAFPDAGWYVMRHDRNYCIISCGPNGQNGNGGHAHNDKLSFELCIDGKDVIVDPGTYVYTPEPDARNRFRGTAYHNTVMVDGEEQNKFEENNLFWMGNDALPRCLKWETGDEVDVFVGEHYGYKGLSQPVVHEREIKFHKKEGKLDIVDKFKGKRKHNLEWNFILSPRFNQELKINSDKLLWHKDSASYSSEYGVAAETKKFISILQTIIPFEVKIRIVGR
ncbi:hypothetical protein ES707_00848 [subsurface metagenome]